MSKLSKLYALAAKAEKRTFAVKREAEGVTFTVRMDGFPSSLTAAATTELAEKVGGRVCVTVPVGMAGGRGTGVLGPKVGGDMMREMTTDAETEPARKAVIRKMSANGAPKTAAATA